MNAILKAVLSFALINVPVRVYAATDERNPQQLHLHHRACGRRLNQRLYCSVEQIIVEQRDAIRGVETADGATLVIEDDELASLAIEGKRTIALAQFVSADEAKSLTRYAIKAYHLEPEPTGMAAYALLRDTMEKRSLVAFATVVLRQREQPCVIEPVNGVLLLRTLVWPSQIRAVDGLHLPDVTRAGVRERQLADTLLASLESPLKPETLLDRYGEGLQALIDAKLAGRPTPVADSSPTPALPDLMAALEASVADARRRRRGRKARRSAA